MPRKLFFWSTFRIPWIALITVRRPVWSSFLRVGFTDSLCRNFDVRNTGRVDVATWNEVLFAWQSREVYRCLEGTKYRFGEVEKWVTHIRCVSSSGRYRNTKCSFWVQIETLIGSYNPPSPSVLCFLCPFFVSVSHFVNPPVRPSCSVYFSTSFSLFEGLFSASIIKILCTRWFKYDRDLCGLFIHKSVPVIFEPPCTYF
jgi:hypothetical protein